MKLETEQGNTIAEYGIFIAIFAFFAVSSLSLLGKSLSDLLGSASGSSSQNQIQAYYSTTLNIGQTGQGKGLSANGAGNGALNSTNSLLTGLSPVAVNVSSVDGAGLHKVQATLTYAQRLQQLADSTTDPSIKLQLENIANDAYWIGGSQATYEYHQNGNTALQSLSQAMIEKTVPSPEIASRALISIHDNENFLKNDLQALLNMPNATLQQKEFAQQIAEQVLSRSQANYQTSYDNLINSNTPLPTAGLRTTSTVDPTTGKTAGQLVMQIGDSLVAAGSTDNTPAVKTSLVDGHGTTMYAQQVP